MSEPSTLLVSIERGNYISEIVDRLEKLQDWSPFERDIKLRKKIRARVVQSTLALKGNPLTFDEVNDYIEGKLITIRRTNEFREVRNAYVTYGVMQSFDPYSVKDFLGAHALMTEGLVEDSGKFRAQVSGDYDGEEIGRAHV
jgi:Fic family protein